MCTYRSRCKQEFVRTGRLPKFQHDEVAFSATCPHLSRLHALELRSLYLRDPLVSECCHLPSLLYTKPSRTHPEYCRDGCHLVSGGPYPTSLACTHIHGVVFSAVSGDTTARRPPARKESRIPDYPTFKHPKRILREAKVAERREAAALMMSPIRRRPLFKFTAPKPVVDAKFRKFIQADPCTLSSIVPG